MRQWGGGFVARVEGVNCKANTNRIKTIIIIVILITTIEGSRVFIIQNINISF